MSEEMEKSYNVLLSILDTLHQCIIITAPAITFISMHSHPHMAMGSQGPTYSKSGPCRPCTRIFPLPSGVMIPHQGFNLLDWNRIKYKHVSLQAERFWTYCSAWSRSKTKALDQSRTLNSLWIHHHHYPPPTENFSNGSRLRMVPRFGK